MANSPAGNGSFQLIKSDDGVVELSKVPMHDETGSSFGYGESLFFGWDNNVVLDYGDWQARDMQPFLTKDYKAKQILNVLQLPISSAKRSIKAAPGDKGEYEWLQSCWDADPLNGGCQTSLDFVIDQSLSAIAYRRAYFEKVFKRNKDGRVFYDKIAFRPQTTCRLAREPIHGDLVGFQQQKYGVTLQISDMGDIWPVNIPLQRAYIYIHGQRIDPINGTSDMDIPYWAYKTKQKIMLLWFQFLESVALPRIMVGAQDIGDARQIATQIAGLRNSGVAPYSFAGSSANVKMDTIDASGKGAEQFVTAISFLDGAAVDSVLAGFLNLTGTAAARGFNATGGSYALSKDASDFFLQAVQAKTREIATSVRNDIFAPITRWNFGRDAAVPIFEFEPLNDEDKSSSITLLQAMITASAAPNNTNPVPTEFVSELAEQVANYLGLDGDKVSQAFTKASADAKAAASQVSAQMASPAGQAVAGMSGAVNAASAATGLNPSAVTTPHGKALLKTMGVL